MGREERLVAELENAFEKLRQLVAANARHGQGASDHKATTKQPRSSHKRLNRIAAFGS